MRSGVLLLLNHEGVWLTTSDDIAEHYARATPAVEAHAAR
jgi:hypothetical protein